MKTVLQHERYGTIAYEESAWTGKRKICINGVELKKTNRRQWSYEVDGEEIAVALKGNTMTGVTLTIGEDVLQIVAKPAWYVVIFSIFTMTFIIAWGASVSLVKIFPTVGGAIGGAISGVFAVVNLYFAGKVEKAWQKILIGLLSLFAAVMVCHAIALVILSAKGVL